MRRANLLGQRFDRLVVVAIEGITEAPCGTKRLLWRCHCDCGGEQVARGGDLQRGFIRSCGCLRKEIAGGRTRTHGETRAAGGKQTREYRAWAEAKRRCFNPKTAGYRNYGGRGIRMCARWTESFEAFLEDMGRCPPGRELDRKKNDGDYEPGNCRWATHQQNSSNQRRNRFVRWQGERMTVKAASQLAGISEFVVYGRLNSGWSVKRALTEPVRRR